MRRSPGYRRRPLVAVIAKAEDEVANAAQEEDQNKTEHRTLPEGFGNVDGHDNRDYDIDQRDQVEKEPPPRPAGNL